MYQLLDGVRIVDLTTVVAGPFATAMLGDLGAGVIKIEAPDGDGFRHTSPSRSDGMGAPFMNINRNKQSVGLNLKHPDGHAALLKIIVGADVVVHNMRPDAVTRLNIGPETLRLSNPTLIYCAAIGYGSDGPYGDRPAYDDVVQAETGWAYLLADDRGIPRLAPTIVADKVAGLYITQAILAALVARHAGQPGATIEVPMFEALASFTLAEHLSGRLFQPPIGPAGYNRLTTPHRRPHRTSDGYIVTLPYTTRHWQAFFELVERPDLAKAAWVLDPGERARNAGELYRLLGEFTPDRTTEQWLADLASIDVPAAPVNSLDDLIDDAHLSEVGMFETIEHPTEGTITTIRHPVRYDGPTGDDRQTPRLGADTRRVLTEAGLASDEVDGLFAEGTAF